MTTLQEARREYYKYNHVGPSKISSDLITALESANREMYEMLNDISVFMATKSYIGWHDIINELLEKYKPKESEDI